MLLKNFPFGEEYAPGHELDLATTTVCFLKILEGNQRDHAGVEELISWSLATEVNSCGPVSWTTSS